MGKNVASDIAEKLCDSVRASLEGKKTGTFTTIKSMVKKVSYQIWSVLVVRSAKQKFISHTCFFVLGFRNSTNCNIDPKSINRCASRRTPSSTTR